MAFQEMRTPDHPIPVVSDLSAPAAQSDARTAASQSSARLIAYYFHGSVRCDTCRTIEAYAREAVETGFAAELSDGRLQCTPLNVEEPGNEHFATDFNLYTRSVVLARMKDGAVGEYRNLEDVWSLVGDKPAFLQYVRDNTRAMLESAP
jgi:hypothetical protein